ncbi:MAG: hypothetical protein ACRDF4_04835 [Rhabdochlamydiaceae bacterium]
MRQIAQKMAAIVGAFTGFGLGSLCSLPCELSAIEYPTKPTIHPKEEYCPKNRDAATRCLKSTHVLAWKKMVRSDLQKNRRDCKQLGVCFVRRHRRT